MAGAGYRLFSTNDVLTAGDLNTYIQEQSVMRFATPAARDAALTSVLAEGMTCYIDDITGNGTAGKCVYDGAAWVITWSEWESFTPSWNNLTLGNGVNIGALQYVSGNLRVQARLDWGTTTSYSGALGLTLPLSEATNSSSVNSINACRIIDSSGTVSYIAIVFLTDNDSLASFQINGSNAGITSTTPMTWGNGDSVRVDIMVPL